jgi:uncharacterized OB-fold protein
MSNEIVKTIPVETHQFSGRGEIYSYTTIYNAPEGYKEYTPYHIAWIRLEEGPLITAQLTDLDFTEKEVEIRGEKRTIREYPQLEIGMPVEMVTRRLKVSGDKDRGMLVYGYKFRPVLEMSS